MVKRITCASVLCLALVIPAASLGHGHKPGHGHGHKTKTTLGAPAFHESPTIPGTGIFVGRVSSSKQSCANNRPVNVYEVQAGADKFVGTQPSAPRAGGGYSYSVLAANGTSGKYYAKATATSKCTGAKSKSHQINFQS